MKKTITINLNTTAAQPLLPPVPVGKKRINVEVIPRDPIGDLSSNIGTLSIGYGTFDGTSFQRNITQFGADPLATLVPNTYLIPVIDSTTALPQGLAGDVLQAGMSNNIAVTVALRVKYEDISV